MGNRYLKYRPCFCNVTEIEIKESDSESTDHNYIFEKQWFLQWTKCEAILRASIISSSTWDIQVEIDII